MGRKSDIREKLALLGVSPKKSHGQNFLFDPNGVERVLEFAAVSSEEIVCEIGPGLGAISRPLAERAKRYVAIEIEEPFAKNLEEELSDIPTASVICADVRDVRLADITAEGEKWSVVSNVPYSVSSEVVLWLIEQTRFLKRATLLFQREFAERVASPPGGKVYGSLSVQSQLVADVKLGPRLQGGLFFPPASVESRLIELRFLEKARFELSDRDLFRRIIRGSFGKRRKTLMNSLLSAELFPTREAGESIFAEAGLDPVRRPETLSVEEFVRLANVLTASGAVETKGSVE